jgi:hypothetical protein
MYLSYFKQNVSYYYIRMGTSKYFKMHQITETTFYLVANSRHILETGNLMT